jgi:hypothetical protein
VVNVDHLVYHDHADCRVRGNSGGSSSEALMAERGQGRRASLTERLYRL